MELWDKLPVLSCSSPVCLFVTPWTVAHQAPLSVGFSRQEYWKGLPALGKSYLENLEVLRSPAGRVNCGLCFVGQREGTAGSETQGRSSVGKAKWGQGGDEAHASPRVT